MSLNLIFTYPNPNPDPHAYTTTNVVHSLIKLEAKTQTIFNSDPNIIQNLIDTNLTRNGPVGIEIAATADSKANTMFVLFKVMSESTE